MQVKGSPLIIFSPGIKILKQVFEVLKGFYAFFSFQKRLAKSSNEGWQLKKQLMLHLPRI